MEKDEYKKMFELESNYWWYVGRRFIIKSILKKYWPGHSGPIFDIGCGTGINLGFLKEFDNQIKGLDISKTALEYCAQRGYLNTELIDSAYALKYPDQSVGMITMFDVLEHIENEEAALVEIRRVLKNNGLFLITVPAYKFLWSEHDIALHHFHRYNAGDLKKTFRNNGFKIIKSSYIITFSFPIILIYRVIKGLINRLVSSAPRTSHVRLPAILNNFLIILLKIEGFFVQYINFPFGSSIIIVAEKNEIRKK